MKIEIVQRPASSAARVALDAGEHVTAEGGSMIAMSGDMDITTTTHQKRRRRGSQRSCPKARW
jgi:uncharacterized protein (AIM24 family)